MKIGPDGKLFDDLARMAGGAVNLMSGLQQQIHDEIKSRFDNMATRMDLVPREDLERAEARIAKLEKQVAELMAGKAVKAQTAKPAKKTAGKPAGKKPAAKSSKKK